MSEYGGEEFEHPGEAAPRLQAWKRLGVCLGIEQRIDQHTNRGFVRR